MKYYQCPWCKTLYPYNRWPENCLMCKCDLYCRRVRVDIYKTKIKFQRVGVWYKR